MERGTSGAPRSGLRSLTAVRAEATGVNTDSKGAPLYIALSMAEALSRLIPNADGRLILVIRHRQARPHQGLHGDPLVPSVKPEPAADGSRLVPIPVIGCLHHRYIRKGA